MEAARPGALQNRLELFHVSKMRAAKETFIFAMEKLPPVEERNLCSDEEQRQCMILWC